jgi:hypothetical protein
MDLIFTSMNANIKKGNIKAKDAIIIVKLSLDFFTEMECLLDLLTTAGLCVEMEKSLVMNNVTQG